MANLRPILGVPIGLWRMSTFAQVLRTKNIEDLGNG
jgi:hypothetical protein